MAVPRFTLTACVVLAAGHALPVNGGEQLPHVTQKATFHKTGAVDYTWRLSSTVGGDAVTSVTVITREFGQTELTSGSDFVTWSEDESKSNTQVLVRVGAQTKNGRTFQVKAAGVSGAIKKLSSNAIITISQRQHDNEVTPPTFTVIDIRVTDRDEELHRWVILGRLAKLNKYPTLVARIHKIRKTFENANNEKSSGRLNSLTHVEDVKDIPSVTERFLR